MEHWKGQRLDARYSLDGILEGGGDLVGGAPGMGLWKGERLDTRCFWDGTLVFKNRNNKERG